jgi:hypothetical protein
VDFQTLALKEGSFDKIIKHLQDNDASFSAHWAGTLGILFIKANDLDAAKNWLDYGLTRDPNNPIIQNLALLLSNHCSNS